MAYQAANSLAEFCLLEIARDHSSIKVHMRCMRKAGGAWEGWAVWPGEGPNERRSYYVIETQT